MENNWSTLSSYHNFDLQLLNGKKTNVHVSNGHWAYYFAYISHSHIHITKNRHLEDVLLRCKSASPKSTELCGWVFLTAFVEADVLLYSKKKVLTTKIPLLIWLPCIFPNFSSNTQSTSCYWSWFSHSQASHRWSFQIKLCGIYSLDKQQLLYTF